MKGKVLLVILTIVLASIILCAAGFDDSFEFKAVLPDTPIYANTDISSDIVGYIPQNAKVNIQGDPITIGNVTWQRIKYTSLEGYVVSTALYKSYTNDDYNVMIAKVKSSGMGKDVPLYLTHSETVGADRYVHDGEKISVIDDNIDYGDFSLVEYDGEKYFILTANVTTGLSYNQVIAVIIIACVAGVVIIVSIIIMIIRRRKLLDS